MADSLPRAAFDFMGGLQLKANKAAQTERALAHLPTPARVRIPLRQHCGAPALACVVVGQSVRQGDCIGTPDGTFSAAVHASISGTVSAIADFPIAHTSGLSDRCIEITAAGEAPLNDSLRLPHDYHLEDPNVLRHKVAEAGIVGLGGAVFPTAIKLSAEADQHLHTLIINGAECEPYISCDDMLMRESATEILRGAQIMLHILQINQAIIAIESDYAAAIASTRTALEQLADDRLSLRVVPTRYPEGGERQLIQTLSGLEVPSDGLPVDIGFLCHNVGTAYAIYDAFIHGRPLISRIVSVCGDGVQQPQNVSVPIGTCISEVIAFCGGYNSSTHRLIIGGPMMGYALPHDKVPVDKASNCILVLPETQVREATSMPCIRCGDCATVCPAGLLPQQLYAHSRTDKLEGIEKLNLFDCIECGCCDYVCPSNIALTEHFRYAKDELWRRANVKHHSDIARSRFEYRELRLARIAEEKARQREERKRQIKDKLNKQNEIQAAIERTKARKDAGERADAHKHSGSSE